MRIHCIGIACLALFTLCASLQSAQGPDRCCFSYSNVIIPIKQVVGFYTTHLECHISGIIFIMKSGNEICADLNERWVQKLKNRVNARNLKEMTEDSSGGSN